MLLLVINANIPAPGPMAMLLLEFNVDAPKGQKEELILLLAFNLDAP